MAVFDGVDVGLLGLLRGSLRHPTRRDMLARAVLGTAIGALAVDAKLSDGSVLALCQAAIDRVELPLYGEDVMHQELAIKILRMAIQEIGGTADDRMAICRTGLARIRAAMSSPTTRAAVDNMIQAIGDARPIVDDASAGERQ